MPKTNLCRSSADARNEKLMQWIRGSNIKQSDLAKALGMSQPGLSRKLTTGQLRTKELIAILHEIGVTKEELAFLLLY